MKNARREPGVFINVVVSRYCWTQPLTLFDHSY